MTDGGTLYLWLLILVAGFLLVRGLLRPVEMLRYPFLASAVVFGWFLPQAVGIANDNNLPPGGYALTMVMATLCLIAALVGDRLGKPNPVVSAIAYDRSKLLMGAGVLSVVGLGAYAAILRTPAQMNDEGLTTGIVTILFFFATLQYYGFALGLALLLKRFSIGALLIVVLVGGVLLSFILFGGRRGPAMDFILIILCSFWFQRRITPPRALVLVGIVGAAIFANSTGQYRSVVQSTNQYAAEGQARLPTIEEVLSINYVGDFGDTITKGSFEVRNAIMDISASQASGRYDLGLSYWNYLVFRYVPAQILGQQTKKNMTVDLPDRAVEMYGYQRHLGTTVTGFSNSFGAFWFFGALVFAAIAALLKKWWVEGTAGSFRSQILYCASLATATEAVTHSTQWFWVYIPQILIFVGPVFWLARINPERIGAAAHVGPKVSA